MTGRSVAQVLNDRSLLHHSAALLALVAEAEGRSTPNLTSSGRFASCTRALAGTGVGCYGRSMTPIPIIARHAAVLLTLVALPTPLQADPITITGGMVEVDVVIADARIRLVGDDFLVRTDTDAFVTALVGDPFPTGTTLPLGGDWLFTGFRTFGEANVNGVHYPEVFFGLPTSGTFTTPSVTLTGGVEGRQTFTVPFTFNGVVTGFASQQEGPTGEQPLFTATLVGSGTARAAFFGFRVDEASPNLVPNQSTRGHGSPPRIRVFAIGADTGTGNHGAPRYGYSSDSSLHAGAAG